MTALLLTLAMGVCTLDDAACWRVRTLEQSERAERAEQRAALEKSAREIVDQMAADEAKRADRWRETAMAVAPKQPGILESPYFWMAVGLVAGVGATVGVAYSLKPAIR